MVRALSLGIPLAARAAPGDGHPPPPPPPPSFTPSDLWVASETGGWWDFSNLSTLRVARDGTGPAPVPGDPVGRASDQGPNGLDLAAPGDSSRPLAVTSPGPGLRFDGIADHLVTEAALSGPDMTIIIAASALWTDDAVDGLVANSSANGNSGTFHLVSGVPGGSFNARLRTTDLPSWGILPSPVAGVLTLVWDSIAGAVSLRQDGQVVVSETGYAGNLADQPYLIAGNRSATAFQAADIGAVIMIGRILTAAELAEAEAWAATRLME